MNNRPVAQPMPWIIVVLCLCFGYLAVTVGRPKNSTEFNLREFGQLPISYGGRIKPLDTVARNALTIISNKQTLKLNGHRVEAIHWLLDVVARPNLANDYEVFRIDHPGILLVLGLSESKKYFSFNRIMERRADLSKQVRLARRVSRNERDAYQRKVLELSKRVNVYIGLSGTQLRLIPSLQADHDWVTLPPPTQHAQQAVGQERPEVHSYQLLLGAYHHDDASTFNQNVAKLRERLAVDQEEITTKAMVETHFNFHDPFYQATCLYVLVAILTFGCWLSGIGALLGAANRLLVLTLVLHTLGLVVRMYLSGRPPVTNLYSSAVFIGWGCVLLCLVLERLFRNGMGTITAAMTGALTLLVARALSGDGDTLTVLQAVLDTNFWLATHVVVITLGYASTLLAGFLGILFVLRGLLTRTLTQEEAKRLGQMIYGIICFATLFSFVGTILGGIWADQSWGRFWGWDPKENGALMIVLWNALILHTRWGGMVKSRGMAVLAIVGNIVTSWSWFGTNMLGAGLHAYGFIESAVFWLLMFIFSQLILIGVGLMPLRWWRSFHQTAPSEIVATSQGGNSV